MKIPLQDPKRQYTAIEAKLKQAIERVLSSGRYLMGSHTTSFEQAFAQFCDVAHCISVANGTDALEIALRAVGCGSHDEVITVANAGGYTTTACRIIGAIPVYVDVEPKALTMDLAAAVKAVTPETKAIVVTHLYGTAVDVSVLRQQLDSMTRQDVAIIEDCAQAHGASINGKTVGSMGTIGTFSFYPTKNLGALGDGGAIVCNTPLLDQKIRQLRQYGWSERYLSKTPFGRNSRMDELQAAILLEKLSYVHEWNVRRRSIVAAYHEAAPKWLQIIGRQDSAYVAHLCIAVHPNRDRFRSQLERVGISTAIHFPVLDCDQQSAQKLPQVIHSLENSRAATEQIFTLPCFPELGDREVEYVSQQLACLSV